VSSLSRSTTFPVRERGCRNAEQTSVGHHHNSHAAIGGSADVRHDIGSLWTQMGHDFQPCAVHYSGAGDGFHALVVGVFGCEGALWDCDVSLWESGSWFHSV
jgi:hypothetical protein